MVLLSKKQLAHIRSTIKGDHAIVTVLQGGPSLIAALTVWDPEAVPVCEPHDDRHSLRQAWTEVNDWKHFWRNLQSCGVATTTNIIEPSTLISDVVVLLGYRPS
jgi:hypothetical protein